MALMSLSTYAGLLDAIASYLKRNNLTDQIPTFVQMAELRLDRDLRRLPQARTVYSFTPTQNINNLPGDFNSMDRVTYNNKTLEFIGNNLASEHKEHYYNNEYTIIGNKLWIQTLVDSASKCSLYYFQALAPLSTDNTSNWLLEDAADCYVYASLLEAAAYIADDAQLAKWTTAYGEAVQSVINAANETQVANSKLVMRKG